MAKLRSPNYPQITFEEAAKRGLAVYKKEHTHASPKQAVAEILGYSSLNGRSLSMIGALRQYGILEGSGDALRISQDAVAYFELQSGDEWRGALQRMLFHPPLFADLHKQYGNTLPSEANLKHQLIRQNFLPKAAEDVIRVYRENMRLVDSDSKRYTSEESGRGAGMGVHEEGHRPKESQAQPPGVSHLYSFPLSRKAKAELKIVGAVSLHELEMLRSHVELTIKALMMEQEEEHVDEDGTE